jgi:hypothetical protein
MKPFLGQEEICVRLEVIREIGTVSGRWNGKFSLRVKGAVSIHIDAYVKLNYLIGGSIKGTEERIGRTDENSLKLHE